MPKVRKYAVLNGVEVIVRLTPASLRDHLLALAEAAKWNAANSEEPGSNSQKDQTMMATQLETCANLIQELNKVIWSGILKDFDKPKKTVRKRTKQDETIH